VDLLVLGGTRFVGRHIVDRALARGHDVTVFHRGTTPSDGLDGAREILGDREGDLSAVSSRPWDAVVDTCGYVPRVVAHAAERLRAMTDRYAFISSISAYAGFPRPGVDESAPLAEPEEGSEEVTRHYGPLKAACERVVEDAFGDRAVIVRPGFVVGAHDYTDRFTYWVLRAAHGGRAVAPGSPDAPLQFIHGSDLGEWVVTLIEGGASGAYNATGPERPLPWGDFLDACNAATGGDASFVWIDERTLEALGAAEHMPLWAASGQGWDHAMEVDCSKAIRAGLSFRPLDDTIREVRAWRGDRSPYGLDAGLDRATEQRVLAAAERGKR
jgi:2'-hydroxyisoflavone reductase